MLRYNHLPDSYFRVHMTTAQTPDKRTAISRGQGFPLEKPSSSCIIQSIAVFNSSQLRYCFNSVVYIDKR